MLRAIINKGKDHHKSIAGSGHTITMVVLRLASIRSGGRRVLIVIARRGPVNDGLGSWSHIHIDDWLWWLLIGAFAQTTAKQEAQRKTTFHFFNYGPSKALSIKIGEIYDPVAIQQQ